MHPFFNMKYPRVALVGFFRGDPNGNLTIMSSSGAQKTQYLLGWRTYNSYLVVNITS